ncbi:DUF2264 domain-containing protein [Streptomyces sp. NPDC056352]|uniref:DUF2264 domain-containing protein n=1 Tax=Streptomyces sp. NPDC056352 TaxID=3345791 RepID=UPI0035D7F406
MTASERCGWAGFRSPGDARYDLPGPNSRYGPDSDSLEGCTRSLLLVGFRIAGEKGRGPHHGLERYAERLSSGTDPHHPGARPRPVSYAVCARSPLKTAAGARQAVGLSGLQRSASGPAVP